MSYLDFEMQMSELSHVMTELEVKKLKEMIVTIARNTTYSIFDVAGYAGYLARKGHSCSEIIDDLARMRE